MNIRIGPRMSAVVEYVRAVPACTMVEVARHVGPHGSTKFGYRVVHRAISAGIVTAVPCGRPGERRLFAAAATT